MAASRKRKATVTDIARLLDLSPSTVSRVLTGSPLVKEETRKRIEEAAEELGYNRRRNRRHGARSILVIALFIPRSTDVYHRLFYDPAELVAGLTAGFGDVRTQISVSVNAPNPDLFASKKSGNIDACVFGFTTPSRDVSGLLRERGIPSVLLNRESATENYVSSDHLTGMMALLNRASSGNREVCPCYISFTPAQPVARSREEAFLEACHRTGVGCANTDVFRINSVHELDSVFLQRLRKRYNTVFCFNDFVAVYLYQVALINGLRIPEDLGIAGYDDSPVRQLTPQPIDSVSLSPYRLGEEAGRWLHRVVIQRSTEPLNLLVPGITVPGATLVP